MMGISQLDVLLWCDGHENRKASALETDLKEITANNQL
jgi:hypothetical protein